MNLMKAYSRLYERFGPQGWWPIRNEYSGKTKLSNSERFEICVGAILTQSASWKNVETALESLRRNNALDKNKISRIKLNKLALTIRSSGYHNQKARKLKAFVEFLNSGKKITRENLLDVWGVGKETADSILLYAYNKPYFVVDAYTKRIFSRIGLIKKDAGYDEVQEFFVRNIPKNTKTYREYHALIVRHAKEYCRKKPECDKCILNKDCKKII
ncbi:MAG: endonuclease [Nanoarchaeota archaeon]